jgi:hypothetical protein
MLRQLVSPCLRSALVLLLFSTGLALAQNQDGNSQGENQDGGGARTSLARSVPEFGPAAAGALAVLVAGGGVLLARRRRR